MTMKRKKGPRKRVNKPVSWQKRTPSRKGINTPPGLTKYMKIAGLSKLFYGDGSLTAKALGRGPKDAGSTPVRHTTTKKRGTKP